MKSLKKTIEKLIQKGKVEEAISLLLDFGFDDKRKSTLLSIAFQQSQLSKKKQSGVLYHNEEQVTQNQIIIHLLEFINEEEKLVSFVSSNPFFNKKIVLIIGIVLILTLLIGWFSFSSITFSSLQLTVFVEDENGNVILENNGMLTIDFGNDRRTAMIGENGRTNFGEIPSKFKGDTIKIGFNVEGYEIENNINNFIFKGKPIHLIVRRDHSLGLIKGIVKSADVAIKGALVRINTDTSILTNHLGEFQIKLPQNMRASSLDDYYDIYISKTEYKTVKYQYYPKSENWIIDLIKDEL